MLSENSPKLRQTWSKMMLAFVLVSTFFNPHSPFPAHFLHITFVWVVCVCVHRFKLWPRTWIGSNIYLFIYSFIIVWLTQQIAMVSALGECVCVCG
jgi:hypothetical protein